MTEYFCPALIITPFVKISNPKEISFEFIHICPLVKSDEIALLHASLNNVSLQPFLFLLL